MWEPFGPEGAGKTSFHCTWYIRQYTFTKIEVMKQMSDPSKKNSYRPKFLLKYEYMDMISRKNVPIFAECHSLYKNNIRRKFFLGTALCSTQLTEGLKTQNPPYTKTDVFYISHSSRILCCFIWLLVPDKSGDTGNVCYLHTYSITSSKL